MPDLKSSTESRKLNSLVYISSLADNTKENDMHHVGASVECVLFESLNMQKPADGLTIAHTCQE